MRLSKKQKQLLGELSISSGTFTDRNRSDYCRLVLLGLADESDGWMLHRWRYDVTEKGKALAIELGLDREASERWTAL